MKLKITAIFILLALIISYTGTISTAEILDPQFPDQASGFTEIPEKRERYTKHFMKPDGSYVAVMYTELVNYCDDSGIWQEIDNSLTASYDRDNNEVFKNASNDHTVEFARSTLSGKLVNIQTGSYGLSWNISSGTSAIAAQTAEIVSSTKASSSIRYASAFKDVDIRYTVSSARIREDIVLNSTAAAATEFQFDITCDGLTAKLQSDKSVSFTDPENSDDIIFIMEIPFMYDSSESPDISYDIEVFLTETKSGYSLVYKPDKTWLDSPERVYPVVIDPTTSVYSTRSSSAIADTYVHSGDSSGDHTLLSYLRIGNAPDGLTRTFIKTDLPTITGGTVYRAKLLLSNTGGSSTFQNVNVYRMNSSWTSSGISWSSHLSLSKTLIASNIAVSAYSNSPSAHRYVCDVTNTVQDFYKGTRTNYGFMVRYTDDSIADYNAFYSSDCGTTNVMPCLYISYVYGETSGITSGEIYYIKNMNSGQYLDVEGAGTSNGTDVIQWHFHGGMNQQWKAIYTSNGLYRFQAMNTTDKYLETASYTNADEVNVDISNLSLSRQKWSILSNGNGSYRILSECSNLTKGATIEEASYSDGATVFQYTYTGSGSAENDDWVFEKINSVLFPKISSLHQCARNYNSNLDISNMLLFQFIRSANSSYTTSNFNEVAGEVDQSFLDYVNNNNNSLNFLRQNLMQINDTEYGPVDFTHLAATTNAILFDSTTFRSILVGEQIVNDLSGWAGDLQTLVLDTINATNNTSSYNTFYNTFLSLLGSDEASFSMKDILADFDAFYLGYNVSSSLFGSQLEYYYTTISHNRFDYFVGTRTFDALKADIRIYTNNTFIIGIQWPLYSGNTVTSVQSQAAADAFTYYLWSNK